MTTVVLRPRPLPLDRVQPGVGLLVLGFHLVILWMANSYWPIQNVLLGAVRGTVQIINVQIFQKSAERRTLAISDATIPGSNPQAISQLGAQRLSRSDAMLALPTVKTESSTPLAATATAAGQTASAAAARGLAATETSPIFDSAAPAPLAKAVRKDVAAAALAPLAPPPTLSAAPPLTTPVPQPEPPPLPMTAAAVPRPALPAAPGATTASPAVPTAATVPTAPAPVAQASTSTAPAVSPNSPSNSPANSAVISTSTSPAPTTTSGSGPADTPGGVTGGTATGVAGSSTAAMPGFAASPAVNSGAPLNLNLPPRAVYRPPIALPRRSLADMANEQLRRKPRDAFAESVESASNIDCLKDTPDGAFQGLLAIGPLLKRAIDEKCRK